MADDTPRTRLSRYEKRKCDVESLHVRQQHLRNMVYLFRQIRAGRSSDSRSHCFAGEFTSRNAGTNYSLDNLNKRDDDQIDLNCFRKFNETSKNLTWLISTNWNKNGRPRHSPNLGNPNLETLRTQFGLLTIPAKRDSPYHLSQCLNGNY